MFRTLPLQLERGGTFGETSEEQSYIQTTTRYEQISDVEHGIKGRTSQLPVFHHVISLFRFNRTYIPCRDSSTRPVCAHVSWPSSG